MQTRNKEDVDPDAIDSLGLIKVISRHGLCSSPSSHTRLMFCVSCLHFPALNEPHLLRFDWLCFANLRLATCYWLESDLKQDSRGS